MKRIWDDFARPVVVLGAICLVTSVLLAVTNDVTGPIIKANAEKKANATRAELLPAADTFTNVTQDISVEGVTEVYCADNGSGYVVTAQSKGYDGQVPVMVSFNAQGSVEAVRFLDNTETPGLGKKVNEPEFARQFAGIPAENFTLGDIDAVTGATFSSTAAVNAINAAIDAYHMASGTVGDDNSDGAGTGDVQKIAQQLMSDAGELKEIPCEAQDVTKAYRGEKYGFVLCTKADGYEKNPVTAITALDDNGVIIGIHIDVAADEGDVSKKVNDPAFTQQFIGKTNLTGIEMIKEAEVSSRAAASAVQKALDAYTAVKGELVK